MVDRVLRIPKEAVASNVFPDQVGLILIRDMEDGVVEEPAEELVDISTDVCKALNRKRDT